MGIAFLQTGIPQKYFSKHLKRGINQIRN